MLCRVKLFKAAYVGKVVYICKKGALNGLLKGINTVIFSHKIGKGNIIGTAGYR